MLFPLFIWLSTHRLIISVINGMTESKYIVLHSLVNPANQAIYVLYILFLIFKAIMGDMVLESFQRVTEKKKEPSENQQLFLLPLIKL